MFKTTDEADCFMILSPTDTLSQPHSVLISQRQHTQDKDEMLKSLFPVTAEKDYTTMLNIILPFQIVTLNAEVVGFVASKRLHETFVFCY